MRGKLIAVLALALIGVVATLVVAGGRGEDDRPPPPDEYYGVNGSVLWLLARDGHLELLDRHLAEIERMGLPFVRANLDWISLEPNPPVGEEHSYDFSKLDQWVGALALHGLRWYPLATGTPSWARTAEADPAGCSIFGAPARADDYAAMLAAVTRRYGRSGSFWSDHPDLAYRPITDYEVWNEPNLGSSWCPTPDPVSYGQLLVAAEGAIHLVDSEARIILGGLSPFDDSVVASTTRRARVAAPEFLKRLAASRPDLRELVDSVGVHAYGDVDTVLGQLAWYRRQLRKRGLSRTPISLNETGWTTSGEGFFTSVTEEQRSRYLAAVTKGIVRSGCGVSSFVPHTWVTAEQDPSDEEQWFGIADPQSGTPYPSALAYAEVRRELPDGGEGLREGELRRLCPEP